jgi:hypothetical protein
VVAQVLGVGEYRAAAADQVGFAAAQQRAQRTIRSDEVAVFIG